MPMITTQMAQAIFKVILLFFPVLLMVKNKTRLFNNKLSTALFFVLIWLPYVTWFDVQVYSVCKTDLVFSLKATDNTFIEVLYGCH